MIKFFLFLILLIHLSGLYNIIKSGEKYKVFLQVITLTWCSFLLMNPTLNPKPFIFLITFIYTIIFSTMFWLYNKTNEIALQVPLAIIGAILSFGIMALFS